MFGQHQVVLQWSERARARGVSLALEVPPKYKCLSPNHKNYLEKQIPL
jgi:hypothetical protein